MSNLSMCVGAYADIPYHLNKIEQDIYSVEELCYLLVRNAYLLDGDTFDQTMSDWLKKQCKLPKLSEQLSDMIRRSCSTESILSLILEYVKYNSSEEIVNAINIVRDNAGLNINEKKLSRADYLLTNKHYRLAFIEYNDILSSLPAEEKRMRAHIYHNKGVIYADLFVYGAALELFKMAYDLSGSKESYQCFLAAKRLSMNEKDYVDYIAKNKEAYNDSLLLEQRMKEVVALYEQSPDRHVLHTLEVFKKENRMAKYYDRIDEITTKLRHDYRDIYASEQMS